MPGQASRRGSRAIVARSTRRGEVRENGRVARTALCPILVQRDDQLAILEGALMAAQRGDGGFAVVSGEAGIGKTRLASELAKEAGQLGCAVLWGACSEAELSLPYLPFVEALGNYLDGEDIATVAERLGPARRELAQLFPRLAEEDTSPQPSDTEQAKLRLFEAIVSLLAIPAEDRTLLLVVEDVHWADDSTRELLPEAGVGEMLAAILRVDEVDPELRELMLERTEGNPFVLEEMLKAATEESEARRVADPGRVSIDRLHIPDTVRDTILLRLARFDPEHVSVLEAAAVLGRTFDYGTLVSVSERGDAEVQAALEAAVAQQLVEERTERPSSYRWRHALTQEAIYNDTVTPRARRSTPGPRTCSRRGSQ